MSEDFSLIDREDQIFLSLESIEQAILYCTLKLMGEDVMDNEVVLYCHPSDFNVISSLEAFDGYEGDDYGNLEWESENQLISIEVEQNEGCIPFALLLKRLSHVNLFQILDVEEAGLNYEMEGE